MFDFKDKVVLIAGAAQDFGRVLAYTFAERGTKLALCDINDDRWRIHRAIGKAADLDIK